MKICNISFSLKKVFFQLLCILNLYSSITASSAAEPPTLLEGYEIGKIDLKFGEIVPEDNKPFTNVNWEKLITTKFEITLQKPGDVSVVVVDAQIYKEEFLKQFTNDDLVDEINAISIFYPCRIISRNNTSDLLNKYVVLFKDPLDYILPSKVISTEPNSTIKRIIKSKSRLQYRTGAVRIDSIPYFLRKNVLGHEEAENKLNQVIPNETDVDSKLYEGCAYYNVYAAGATPVTTGDFEVTKVAFKNIAEKPLVKSDNKYWLGAVVTETMVPVGEKNANEHYADFVLKTPFEVSENDVKKMVGSLHSDRENYNYLKLFYTQEPQTYKIECYPKGSTNCNVVHGLLESPGFPSTVTLDLGNKPRETWKSYKIESPILDETLRKKFSNPNDSNMIAMMTHALNQNTTIKKVIVHTSCLTPSMYEVFYSWFNGEREIVISCEDSELDIFASDSILDFSSINNFFNSFKKILNSFKKIPSIKLDKELSLTEVFIKKITSPSQNLIFLNKLQGRFQNLYERFHSLKYYAQRETTIIMANIYSQVASLCYQGKIVTTENGEIFYQTYDEWKKRKIFSQVVEEHSLGSVSALDTIGKFPNENLLQAIFYANQAYQALGSEENKKKVLFYSQKRQSIMFLIGKSEVYRDGILRNASEPTFLRFVGGVTIQALNLPKHEKIENQININIQQAIKTMVGESK